MDRLALEKTIGKLSMSTSEKDICVQMCVGEQMQWWILHLTLTLIQCLIMESISHLIRPWFPHQGKEKMEISLLRVTLYD